MWKRNGRTSSRALTFSLLNVRCSQFRSLYVSYKQSYQIVATQEKFKIGACVCNEFPSSQLLCARCSPMIEEKLLIHKSAWEREIWKLSKRLSKEYLKQLNAITGTEIILLDLWTKDNKFRNSLFFFLISNFIIKFKRFMFYYAIH